MFEIVNRPGLLFLLIGVVLWLMARLGATFVPMGLAGGAYFLAATLLGIREASDVLAVLRRRKRSAAPEAGTS